MPSWVLACLWKRFAGVLLGGMTLAGALWAQPAGSRTSFAVGLVRAEAGTRASGFIEIPPREGTEAGTRIPVTVIHGAQPGPVLGLIAGTHGYEYAPIVALQRLPAQIDPQKLAGTVIVVHIANLPSFLGRTIYYSPVDGKNLNRVYPGRADGTISERIAHAITEEVIARSDFVVDLHCGDGNEALRPYTYWMTSGTAEVNEQSKQMALAFGLDHIVIDRERTTDPENSVYTSNTAILRGKPSITTETGLLGRVDEASIGLVEAGVFNLLRHFRMLPGMPNRVEHPIWIDRNVVLRSPHTGLFYARVKPGQTVAEGTVIGVLTDFHGNVLEQVRAPFAGVVLYVVATPPVSTGEPLGMIGHLLHDELQGHGGGAGAGPSINPNPGN
ncbi:MAG: succinylglutamate desuccinylase/aspartoacylase family protein [Firmicutes bacterium]|nr:succinylglutamate desuccinylase/aspartoacylase family protein [Bacillota bacterium]